MLNYLIYLLCIREGINKDLLKQKLAEANEKNVPLYALLLEDDVITDKQKARMLAQILETKYNDIEIPQSDLSSTYIRLFPQEKVIDNHFIPWKMEKGELLVLVDDVSNIFKLEELNCYYDGIIRPILTTRSIIKNLLPFVSEKLSQGDNLNTYTKENKDALTAQASLSEEEILDGGSDAPMIKLVDSVFLDAIKRGASDIHIEPAEETMKVRFRVDGKMIIADEFKMTYFEPFVSRVKVLAQLNIAEKRVPQDGKISQTLDGIKYDFRVSSIPTIFGEKIVIRIFNKSFIGSSLEAIGMNKEQLDVVEEMIARPYGIILVAGPTGSGKSTSLYSFLRKLNKVDTNIITVEDPVENVIPGINQVQTNDIAGLTFASALRSILRQDPNVIMIGEIRDEETANIAARAAITGHLVLSTIHTNDAAGVVSRLINMGVPPYLVSDSFVGAISQRLVRKLCDNCKKEVETTKDDMEILHIKAPTKIYKPCGCPKCNNTGYLGRLGVFEILTTNEEVKKEILKQDFTADRLNKINKQKPLLDHARARVLNGETSISELRDLEQVIKNESQVKEDK